MAIAVVQCKDNGSGAGGASITVSGLAAITTGNTIVCFVGWNSASVTLSSFSGGGGIAVGDQSGSTQTDGFGDNSHTACFIKKSATSADTSWTVNFSGSVGSRVGVSIFELSGCDQTTQPDVAAHSQISHNISSSADAGSGGAVTTVTNNCVVLGYSFMAFTGTSSGIAIGTGETLGANSNPGDSVSEYKSQASAGSVNSTFTATGASGTTDLSSWTVPIRPAGAAYALVQKATNGTISPAGNFTVQLTGVTAGNFLTLQASLITPSSSNNNVSFAKPTDTNGTWQLATTFSGINQISVGSAIAGIAFSRNVAAGTHTVTVSNAQGFSLVGHATLSEWSGLPANASVDTIAVSNATTAQTNTVGPTNTIVSNVELVLAAITQFPGAGAANIAITDPPTGFTSQYVQNATNAGDIGAEHSYFITSSAGTQTAQWSWTDATTTLSQGVIAVFMPFGTQVQVFYRLPQHFVDESLILT